jgi:hypothetical protein
MPAADHDLTSPTSPHLPDEAAGILDGWLQQVAAALPGPRRARLAILDELRDGLHEATRTRLATATPPAAAARAATEEFGDPAALARVFAPELAAARARSLTLILVGTGPLVGITWLLGGLAATPAATRLPLPPWKEDFVGVWAVWPMIPAAVAIVLAAGLLVWVTTGRLSRWLPTRPRLAPTAAATAGAATATADLTLLILLTAHTLSSPHTLGPLLLLAAAASLTRLTLTTRATHHCLTASGVNPTP